MNELTNELLKLLKKTENESETNEILHTNLSKKSNFKNIQNGNYEQDKIKKTNNTPSVTSNDVDLQKTVKPDRITNEMVLFIKIFQTNIKKLKKLSQENFLHFRKIIKNEEKFITFLNLIFKKDVTKNEAIVIGRGIMQTKIVYNQKLLDFLVEMFYENLDQHYSIRNAILIILMSYLCKSVNVNVLGVVSLLKSEINRHSLRHDLKPDNDSFGKKTTGLNDESIIDCNFLRLMLVLSRNYTYCFDSDLVNFCKLYDHGICKEIARNLSQ
ncbi:hypothetical protein EDEG_02922 [Edhazardia aedis USNM 41457]|uniref:Uncharacterized protein n=1 Tax=Edhazardia aedis (strain USNM 41457) TaxID=1003232 RepID=J9DJA8_EDHAE|nr:hypothetical protein EDEG_02922 [Edhazardia aedis USNM 41457]|eukprot:EJW02690.1 hypothetical protein EDEG_02922 [Edhazardia aedis USNM 41457]